MDSIKSPTNAIREIEIPYKIPINNGFSQFIKNAKNIASKIEQDIPPIKPSIVLLGDIGDRDVLPNDFPIKTLCGENDRILGKKEIKNIRNIEKLNFVGLQNCGHLPHVDLPSLSSKIIQDYFLD